MVLPEDTIECTSMAAYDLPVLLGPIKTVSGRSEMDAFLIGPKLRICMSRQRGSLPAIGGDFFFRTRPTDKPCHICHKRITGARIKALGC